jgi:hypothetical protein
LFDESKRAQFREIALDGAPDQALMLSLCDFAAFRILPSSSGVNPNRIDLVIFAIMPLLPDRRL